MVPPDAFSTAAPQSSSDFCKGCDAGTQCDSFSSKVFSCAKAAVVLTASSKASKAFLIGLPPLGRKRSLLSRLYLTCYIQRIRLSRRVASVGHTSSVPSGVPWQTVIRYNQLWCLHMAIADRRLMPSWRKGGAYKDRYRRPLRHSGTAPAGLCAWSNSGRPSGGGHRRAAR